MPALFTNQDAAIVELRTNLAKVTAERDRARDTAVALEQEVAADSALRDAADDIERELICCPTDDPAEAKHEICRWAIASRNLVLERIGARGGAA